MCDPTTTSHEPGKWTPATVAAAGRASDRSVDAILDILRIHTDGNGIARISKQQIAQELGGRSMTYVHNAVCKLLLAGTIAVIPQWRDEGGTVYSEKGALRARARNAYQMEPVR